ncbi:uncharacterized protein LOC129581416 [Paramacrobiotus metropolitanus]|uniref:uncharacterized protein LOC129581416 n=1 Tax=Paramacrobiotus metropolitanus TaxID=2943436 RepID=UPI0024460507|nr:uncharacterized protein LOC129581416 [Paramacrobiotus metropolitanus]
MYPYKMTHQQVLRFFCGLNIAFGIGLAILEISICIAKLNEVGSSADPEEMMGLVTSFLTIFCAVIVILLNSLVKGYTVRDRIYEILNCTMTFGCFALLLAVVIVFFSRTIVDPGGITVSRNLYGLKLTAIISAFILLLTMTITYFLCVYSCGRVVACRQFDQTFTSKVTYSSVNKTTPDYPASGPAASVKSDRTLQSDVFLEPSDAAAQRKYLSETEGKTFSCSTDTTLSDF